MQTDTQRIALVTGASRGIGRAIAMQLAQEGCYVIGTARSEKAAMDISEAFEGAELQGEGIVLDVTDEPAVERFFETLSEIKKVPNILVNNAGITSDNLFLRMDEDEWSNVINTNLTAVYRVSKHCIKSMFRARWGRVITIGSVVGTTGNSGQGNYCAAKAGVVGMSKALAQEVASRGVTVNVVSPGFIASDMTEALPDLVKSEMLKRIPMKKMGSPEDIADAVSFLASDKARYITGETLHVNGGMLMA